MTNSTLAPVPFARNYALFLDVDGTLADFQDDPAAVTLSPTLLELLSRLQHQLRGALALISGRSGPDLQRLTHGLMHGQTLTKSHDLCCLGLHGLTQNACCPGGAILPLPSAEITPLREQSQAFCQRYPGVRIEDKALGLALHYRSSPQWQSAVQQFAQDYMESRAGHSDFVVLQGKRVVEFRPAGADKGQGIARLLQYPPFSERIPVFIGDDVTDEAGFAVVNRGGGVSVKCGGGPSCAQFRLVDVAAVRDWLTEFSAYLAADAAPPGATREVQSGFRCRASDPDSNG